ncbi:MAG: DHH family phosphoesterase [Candidatus Jordarchaeales archaeon]
MPSSQLISHARSIAEFILERARSHVFQVVSHLDADGLAAASIMLKTLRRIDAKFHARIVHQLSERVLKSLPKTQRVFVFTDLGSGQLSLINEVLRENVVIIDHHPPENDKESFMQINPHLFGLDGGAEISGAGMAYLVSKEVNDANRDLSTLAVIGALGDRQDKGEGRSLTGLNAEIVREAIELGVLEEVKDLMFFGRETRPIPVALEYTMEPFIPGLSGNHAACVKFLVERVKIPLKSGDRWRTLSELSQQEKSKLVSELVKYMLGPGGMSADEAQSIIGTVYVLTREPLGTPTRDAREFAFLLNACGRTGKTSLGLAVCMGDRNVHGEVAKVASEYRAKLADYMEWLGKGKVNVKGDICWFNGERYIDDKMIGTVTSILSSSKSYRDKVIVGFAYSEEEAAVKVSARLGSEVKKEVNLGELMRYVVNKMGLNFVAGGHDLAAGAYIPAGREEEFIEHLNAELSSK